MSFNAGTVTSTLAANAGPFVEGHNQAAAALFRSKAAVDQYAMAMMRGSRAAQENQAKAVTLAGSMKDLGGHATRFAGAFGMMSAAMGNAGGETQKWTASLGAAAMMIGSGGPVGIALAAATVALTLMNEEIAEQEKLIAELDKQWQDLTKAGMAARAAAQGALTTNERELATMGALGNRGSSGTSDEITRRRAAIGWELVDIQNQITAAKREQRRIEDGLSALSGEALEKAKEAALAHQASVAHHEQAKKAREKDLALVPQLVEQEERLRRIAAARAEAEAKIKQALQEQRDLMRSIAAAAAVAGMLPGGGRLAQSDFIAGGADSVAPAFSQLTIGGTRNADGSLHGGRPMLDLTNMSQPAKDAGAALAAVSSEASKLAINLPASTKSVAEAVADMGEASRESARAMRLSAADMISYIGGAIVNGAGGAAAGAGVGGIAGAAIGMATGLDPTGVAGGAIGELLGGLLGSLLDEVVAALGVLTPVFDGLAMVVVSLQPILLVLRELFMALMPVWMLLAAIVLDVAKPLAAIILIAVRIVEVLLPLVTMFLTLVHAGTSFLDVLTVGVARMDVVMRSMVQVMLDVANGWIGIVNDMTRAMRKVFGDDFGVILDRLNTNVNDVIGGFGDSQKDALKAAKDLADGMDDAGASAREYGDTFDNLPDGYKAAGAMFDAADGDPRRGGGGGFGNATFSPVNRGATGIIIRGDLVVQTRDGNVGRAVAEEMARRRGVWHGAIGGADDDEN